LRLGGRLSQGVSFENDDRPGKKRKKQKDEKNDLDDQARIGDQLKNVHGFRY
jgi:hypothetical protein